MTDRLSAEEAEWVRGSLGGVLEALERIPDLRAFVLEMMTSVAAIVAEVEEPQFSDPPMQAQLVAVADVQTALAKVCWAVEKRRAPATSMKEG